MGKSKGNRKEVGKMMSCCSTEKPDVLVWLNKWCLTRKSAIFFSQLICYVSSGIVSLCTAFSSYQGIHIIYICVCGGGVIFVFYNHLVFAACLAHFIFKS